MNSEGKRDCILRKKKHLRREGQREMFILNYKPINKGCLIGKFDIEIKEWGSLRICECTVFQKDGKRWISLPGKQYESKEGQKKHFSLVKFNQEVFKKLEASALTQLEKLISAPQQQTQQINEASSLPF